MSGIMFEVTEDIDGGYVAECLTESILTQADSWKELRANVRDAVDGFYFDREKPSTIRLRFFKDEIVPIG